MMKFYIDKLVRFVAVLNAIASGWIFLIMVIMVSDVVGRAFFNSPLTGTPEIVKVSLVGIIFLQMPHTFWKGRHIRSDFLLTRLHPAARKILNILSQLLVILFFVGIFYSSWERAINSWQIWEFEGEGALRVPVYPIQTIILAGCILTVTLFVYRLLKSLVELFAGRLEEDA